MTDRKLHEPHGPTDVCYREESEFIALVRRLRNIGFGRMIQMIDSLWCEEQPGGGTVTVLNTWKNELQEKVDMLNIVINQIKIFIREAYESLGEYYGETFDDPDCRVPASLANVHDKLMQALGNNIPQLKCPYFPERIEQGCQNPEGKCPPSDMECFLNKKKIIDKS